MNVSKWLAGALLSALMVSPGAAGTQGWYVSLEGGGSWVDEWEHTRTKLTWCGPEVRRALAAFETGWSAFGSVGYGASNWRVEFEGGYRHNELESYFKEGTGKTVILRDEISFVAVAPAGASIDGELTEASVMFNVIYDVPLLERLSMAIGVGAGADYADFRMNTPWAPVDEDNWHFAYQGIAGLNYAITQATFVFVNYRYMNVRDVEYDPTSKLHLEGDDYRKHAATAGVRFALTTPAVVVVTAPPTTPIPVPLEREFMVFFGFNKSTLTPQALATIRQAVKAVHTSGSASIQVVGHTDRSGSIAYNKALSVRRAKTVKNALIAEGIAGGSISTSGRGESEPLVQTSDGVRESQNRRVHISF